MAIIFKFPTDRQRSRADTERTLINAVDSAGVLNTDEKKNLIHALMSTYDEYSKWSPQGVVEPPAEQPFTNEQREAIRAGMQAMHDDYREQRQKMFLDILTLKHKLYMLEGP